MDSTCEDIKILFKGYLAHSLTRDQENDVEIHLSHCASCRILLHDMMVQKEDGLSADIDQPVSVVPIVIDDSVSDQAPTKAEAEETLSVFEQFMQRRREQLEQSTTEKDAQPPAESPRSVPDSPVLAAPITTLEDTPLPPKTELKATPLFVQSDTPVAAEMTMSAAPKAVVVTVPEVGANVSDPVVEPVAVVKEIPVIVPEKKPAFVMPTFKSASEMVQGLKEEVAKKKVAKAEQPKIEQPKIEQPKAEQKKAEQPKVEPVKTALPNTNNVVQTVSSKSSAKMPVGLFAGIALIVVAGLVFVVGGKGTDSAATHSRDVSAENTDRDDVDADTRRDVMPRVVPVNLPPVRKVEPIEMPQVKMLAGTVKIPKLSEELKVEREKKERLSKSLDEAEKDAYINAPRGLQMTERSGELSLNNRVPTPGVPALPNVARSVTDADDVVAQAQKAAVNVSDDEVAEYANKTIAFKTEDSRYFLGVARETLSGMTDGPLLVDDSQTPYVLSVYLTNKQAADFVEKMSYNGATKIDTKFRTKPEDFDKKSMFYMRIE